MYKLKVSTFGTHVPFSNMVKNELELNI